jgi:UDP-N-acetylmuramyl tripeptide synthase
MLNGIVNALALQINPFKSVEYSVIETDEAFLVKVYYWMKGDYLLVTNLFEDQTDRFANPLITKQLIDIPIGEKPNIQLILNADEPISASFFSAKDRIYYSVNSVKDVDGNYIETTAPEFACPFCNKKLNYNKCYYAQVGHYSCECGYKNQEAKYNADVVLHKTHSTIILNDENFEIPLVGLYNAYNALGAIALAKELGLKNIKENLKTFKVAFGRSERRSLYGNDTLIQLIKNPAGTNEVLKTVDLNSNILIAVNNNIADGTDISWINQADFEKLRSARREIVVTGLCSKEMVERLEKAEIRDVKVIPDINKAVEYIGKTSDNNITILTTYTALLKIDKIKEMKKCF